MVHLDPNSFACQHSGSVWHEVSDSRTGERVNILERTSFATGTRALESMTRRETKPRIDF
eukprot:3685559-Amphidinium_carterae.1